MSERPHTTVLLLTALGFGTLYTPQPLLPLLAEQFGVGAAQASLLVTVTMLPLAVAPLLYGFVLEGVDARRMMTGAALGLALCQAGLAMAGDWWQLVVLRGLEGLLLPALFTALMTFTAASAAPGRAGQAMAWYVATSILGGFAGRALGGLIAEHWHWRAAFAVWAVGLLLALTGRGRLPAAGGSRFTRPHPRVFGRLLGQSALRHAYLAIFCLFFLFAGFLNVLPFRLRDLAPGLGSGALGLAYAGYLAGIAAALGGQWLTRRLGAEPHTLWLGLLLYGCGLAVLLTPAAAAVYLGMPLFCAGMFLLHGRLSGHVNHQEDSHRGMVNGLYLCAYYLGGSLGSWAAPLVYRQFGWEAMPALFGSMLLAAGASLARLYRAPRQQQ